MLEKPEQPICQKTTWKRYFICRHPNGFLNLEKCHLFAKFIHLRKVSGGGASQWGGVLHQHHLAPVLVHLDHLPRQGAGSQRVESGHFYLYCQSVSKKSFQWLHCGLGFIKQHKKLKVIKQARRGDVFFSFVYVQYPISMMTKPTMTEFSQNKKYIVTTW